MSQEENRINEGEEMHSLNSVNDLKEVVKEPKIPRRRLNKKSVSVPEQVLDDFTEPTSADLNDKVGKKRQRKNDESGLDKSKNKKKKQNSVSDSENSTEITEMWDSITNNKNSPKDGDNVVVKRAKKDDEVETLFKMGRKKKKELKDPKEIAMLVEHVMATLEIAAEDDVEQNRQGKPAINKLMKLPLLNEALSKKHLQPNFLDHGLLNLLKNWLEPLPDGSLPNITIRAAILKILDDLSQFQLAQDGRREQLTKSGLGKVIMFLSKSDEETTPIRRLAAELVNKWSRIVYNNSTRYENMLSQEEQEEQEEMLLTIEKKKAAAPKVYETRARDFNTDVDFYKEEYPKKAQLAHSKAVGRARVPEAMLMDFAIRPKPKVDRYLKSRAKLQMDDGGSAHENIMYKLKQQKMLTRKGMQAMKVSADGRTMLKYL